MTNWWLIYALISLLPKTDLDTVYSAVLFTLCLYLHMLHFKVSVYIVYKFRFHGSLNSSFWYILVLFAQLPFSLGHEQRN